MSILNPLCYAEPSTPITLGSYISSVLEQSPKLAWTKEEKRAAIQRIRQAEGQFYPTLSIEGLSSAQVNEVNTPSTHQITLSATQNLYDASRQADIKLRRVQLGENDAQIKTNLGDEVYEIGLLYIEYYLAQQELALAKKQLKYAQKQFQLAKRSYDAGKGVLIDLKNATMTLTSREISGLDAESSLQEARQAFLDKWPEDPEDIGELAPPEFRFLFEAPNINNALRNLRSRGDAQLFTAQMATQSAQMEFERAAAYPTLGLRAQAGYQYTDALQSPFAEIRLELVWSLYDGGIMRSRLRELTSTARATRWRYRDTLDRAKSASLASWKKLQAAYLAEEKTRFLETTTEENLNLRLKQYQGGLIDLIEVIRALDGLFSAQAGSATAKANIPRNQWELLWELGRLASPQFTEVVP